MDKLRAAFLENMGSVLIKGAQLRGESVIATIGGNLRIES
jgi:hypothetical protein